MKQSFFSCIHVAKYLKVADAIIQVARFQPRWVEHFENMLNRDTVAGKDIDENEKVCDTLDVEEDLFSKEELATVLKELKNNKAPGADSMINEFLNIWWL